MKVLIVDDSRFVRKVIRKCFDGLDVNLREAADGKDALENFRSMGGCDLILTDWNMPVMDGLEFVQELARDSGFPAPKIVMITTENEQFKIVQAIEAGCDDYMMKPFQPDELLNRLRNILGPDHEMFSKARA